MQSRIMWPISKETEVHTNRPIRWARIEIIRWDFKVITIKFMFNDLKGKYCKVNGQRNANNKKSEIQEQKNTLFEVEIYWKFLKAR